MRHLHIKNLEKYQPGYKDRALIWCKVYFSILNGDPEFELLEEIDKWRFIAFTMLELILKKPVPLEEQYLRRKGFDFNRKSLSASLEALWRFVEITGELIETAHVTHQEGHVKSCVPQNRVEKNRIDKEKKQASPPLKVDPPLVELLDKVLSLGFNPYACINRIKKERRWSREVPENVVMKVCERFIEDKQKGHIENEWPWFKRVFVAESQAYFASEQIKEHEQYKKEPVMIGDILKQIQTDEKKSL